MKKAAFVISVIVLLVVINNLARSIYDLLKKQDIITSAQTQFEEEKFENEELRRELAKIDNKDFIEKEARDKLFLVKPDEKEVILPETETQTKEEKKESPNYQKWLEIFGFYTP
ncbi:MAG: hypothetical protein UU21_C0003G0031 [Candidatus Levybacteria bacterium GW2011_GWA2_40_8]|nr:MAG: hypothetical protein UU21_C0003G0031 [Candidatus Levybacteria bacterium GW2011_GWA2_40_8]